MHLLVYIETHSARANYIFSTLFNSIGVPAFDLTSDKLFYKNANTAKINYSLEPLATHEIWIEPAKLLFETDLTTQKITCFDHNGFKAFYRNSAGDIPFDLFAASFYLISRYEEYLPHEKDSYGRYAHQNSLAYKENFLHLPLVNLWLQTLISLLHKKFPSLTLHSPAFNFIPTYDIDIAYSYLHKGLQRNVGGFIRSMWASEWSMVGERMQVLFNKLKDPFDCYNWLDRIHNKYDLKPVYFVLLAQGSKGYDKNISPAKNAMKVLIRDLCKDGLGIHPSWQSGDSLVLLKQEISILEKGCAKQVSRSRQHYIRMSLPDTYRTLLNVGIKEDYTMGYGSINGFRASFCLPHQWYDLHKEVVTGLTIHPFCYMDANSYFEQHYSSKEALQEMLQYYQVIKSVGGTLITIWHNHFLGTDKMFKGWKETYEIFLEAIKDGRSL